MRRREGHTAFSSRETSALSLRLKQLRQLLHFLLAGPFSLHQVVDVTDLLIAQVGTESQRSYDCLFDVAVALIHISKSKRSFCQTDEELYVMRLREQSSHRRAKRFRVD